MRLAVKQYVELPGATYCSNPSIFKAPMDGKFYQPDHRYHLFSARSGDTNPNAHLFMHQERHLIIERQARDEERRSDTIKVVNRSLANLAMMTGVLVQVPEGKVLPPPAPPPPAAAATASGMSTAGS